MSKTLRNILITFGILLLVFFLWFFSNIVAYILVSAVLTLVGAPLVEFMGRFHIKKFRIPVSVRAFLTLAIFWVIFIGFFRIFVPIVAREANELSKIDVNNVITQLADPINKIEGIYQKFKPSENADSFQEFVSNQIESVLDVKILTNFFSSLASILGNIFVAAFSISFITFFLLREPGMLSNAILLLIPQKHEKAVQRALKSSKHLLSRYFIGIGGQLTGILTLVTLGMVIVGLEFKQALLIGLFAAILNVVPYLGPIIGSSLGVLMGIAFHVDMGVVNMLPLIGYMILVFLSVQLIDNTVFQPLIFSNSVNAHPLEIFLVIMMAGTLAGVTGMIVAIPTFTILRVFAKEFLNNFKLVKKLTENI